MAQLLVSLVGIVCFVGFVLLSIYIGNGLIVLPYNMIVQWWEQPKKITASEMTSLKNKTKKSIKKLIDLGRDLKSRPESPGEKLNIQLESRGWLSRMWGDGGYSNRVALYSNETKKMEKELQIYRLQISIQDHDPSIPLVKLVFGICGAILSLLVFLNM